MASENVLMSGIEALDDIKKELSVYNGKKENLDSAKHNLSQLQKQLNSKVKERQDSIDKTIKKRREGVASSFDKEISKEQGKLKEAKNQKSKVKQEKVKDRIKDETTMLNEENARLKKEIKAAVAGAGAPSYCASNWYYSLFMPKGAGQYFKLVLMMLIAFLAIPGLICVILPETLHRIVVIIVYGVIVIGIFALYNAIERKTLVPYNSVLLKVRDAKETIKKNKKEIAKISKHIRKDKDEDVYELGTYVEKIKEREIALENISDRKQDAIDAFDKNTKNDIIREHDERYGPEIEKLKNDVEKLEKEVKILEAQVKEQKLLITENYEAYMGKEFMKEEKIDELIAIIKAGQASNVSNAMRVSKARR